MTGPEFELVPIGSLHIHERVDPDKVEELRREIERTGTVEDPIWVERGSGVILNGHHRFEALQKLGATRVPAWIIDYDDPAVHLDRWNPGPDLTKSEVRDRAREGRPFPPKTTRHTLEFELPAHPTPLSELTNHAGPDGGRRFGVR
ncbi:MAG TPA: ParB N-terminal domain-containing protein [Thermoplasmata archaeon]|nr:ParB N-terminal domain-containing protein [Thermoplasmata archaeon]